MSHVRVGGLTPLRPALAVAVALVVSACGTSEQPTSATPTTAGSITAGSLAATPSETSSSSDTTSAEPSPSPTPVTGNRFDAGSFSVVVPDGWSGGKGVRSSILGSATFASPEMTTLLDLTTTAAPGSPSLEEIARISLRSRRSTGARRQPDREVGGQQAFVITSDTDSGTTYSIGSLSVGGTRVGDITLSFAPASVSGVEPDPVAEQALVESVLATVQWVP